MVESLLVSKREAAVVLGVSIRTLENLIALRELPVRRVGRRRLIEREALARFARRDHPTKHTEPFIPGRDLLEEASTTPEQAKPTLLRPFIPDYHYEGDELVKDETVKGTRKTKSRREAAKGEPKP